VFPVISYILWWKNKGFKISSIRKAMLKDATKLYIFFVSFHRVALFVAGWATAIRTTKNRQRLAEFHLPVKRNLRSFENVSSKRSGTDPCQWPRSQGRPYFTSSKKVFWYNCSLFELVDKAVKNIRCRSTSRDTSKKIYDQQNIMKLNDLSWFVLNISY